MHKISETRILPFSVRQLYELVIDVDSYKDFLPFCVGSKITKKNEENMEADLTISVAGFRDSYSSRIVHNICDNEAEISVVSISGPLKSLHNIWQFSAADKNSTIIKFSLAFEMQSVLLDKMISIYLDKIRDHMLEAFERRAIKLYPVSPADLLVK